ncbi:hypothetical protein BC834DRAFT_924573 [Gloeopeniophorella convolvens]|nr:hypothetical protein BC834DRAFT_924573 [Gloeopeniophorella convolvens]
MRATQIRRLAEGLLSTVHRGTAFENRSLSLLQSSMSMSLTRVGGRGDGGIDLTGWWWLPEQLSPSEQHPPTQWSITNRRRLRVLAQCKAETKKMGPAHLRELEGVVYKHVATSAPSHPTPDAPIIALLISASAFTRPCLLAAHASPVPLLLVHLPPGASAAPGAAFGNPALLAARGVLRGEVEVRWERGAGVGAGAGRPALWWCGRPLANWTPAPGAAAQ